MSLVLVCSGMIKRVMKRALDFKIPHSMPHVSRFRRVFEDARERNWWRSWDGRKTGRSGSPFSRKAEGLKVNSSSSPDGVGGRASCTLLGNGGAPSETLPGTGGGRDSYRGSYGEDDGLGGRGGGADGGPEGLYICSFGGRAGAERESGNVSCAVLWGTAG